MKKWFLVALSLLAPTSVLAQNAVLQSGPVVTGHIPVWVRDHMIGDSGRVPAGGTIPAVIIDPIGTFGCIGDGVADDTTCMQAALNASGTAHVPVWLGKRLYKVGSLTVPPNAKVLGTGMGFYPAGQIGDGGVPQPLQCASGFVARSTNLSYLLSLSHDNQLQDFCIKAGTAGVNTSGKTISTEEVCDTSAACPQSYNHHIDKVLVDGACVALAMSGQFINVSNSWFANILPAGTNAFNYCGGIRVGAMTNSNRTIQPSLYNNTVYTSFDTPAQYSLLLMDAGGPFITNNSWNVAKYNVWIHPEVDPGSSGSQNIQAINSTGNYLDWAALANLKIDCPNNAFGMSNGGSVSNGDWFASAGRATTGSATAPAISISSGPTGCHVIGFQINNARITGSKGNGIEILDSGVWSLGITNSHICATGFEGGTGPYGILLASGAGVANQGITIANNLIGKECDGLVGNMTSAINLGGTNLDLVITGNNLSNTTTPILVSGPAAPGGNSIVNNNKGVDDVAISTTAAALTALPINPRIIINGGGTLALPSSTYCCPRKELLPISADVTLSGGALSLPSHVAPAGKMTVLDFIGSNWWPN